MLIFGLNNGHSLAQQHVQQQDAFTKPFMNLSNPFSLNPMLYSRSSFGLMDCGFYNFYQTQLPFFNTTNSCETSYFSQNESAFAGQLGESGYRDETGIPRFDKYVVENLKDPFGEYMRHANSFLYGPNTEFCGSDYEDGDTVPAVNLDITLSEEEREELREELGDQPSWKPAASGLGSLVELASTGNSIEDQEAAGYYRYNDGDKHVFATERVAWNIKAAGKILAEKKIVMGVGELSAKGGATLGHSEHQGGRDVDLRLVGKRSPHTDVSRAAPCTVNDSSCYDRDNTFEMIKAFIDVDPFGIDKVFINDSKLQKRINNYLEKAYGIKSFNGMPVARSCSGHDDHVHLSFKNNGTNPDDLARSAK